MTGRGVVRHLAALTLVGEGSLLILVVLGLMAFTSVSDDGSVNVSFPPPDLLLIMAVGAVLIAGAVGTWLRSHRSPRVKLVSSVLVTSALLANVVVFAFSLTADTGGLMTGTAGIALLLQTTEWWLTRSEPVVLH